jgi:spermidine synthase
VTTATAPPPVTATPRAAARNNEVFVLVVLCGLLLCSGAAGLMYQVVWVRLLSLAFGVTVFSISTVLAAFMGGLAIGSVVGGRVADRVSRPLVVYGVVELGIGLTALATPLVFGWLQGLYRELSLLVDPAQAPLVAGAVRGVLVFVMLLVPTALMGASLPLAVRGVRRAAKAETDADVRRDTRAMGLLYALNTTGAILGTLAAGFAFIGSVGIGQTVAVAAGLNAVAGLGALALAAISSSRDNATRSVPASKPSDANAARLARAAFWGFGISGAVSLAYEVVWSRVLAILFNSTIYGFVLMLATVLFGIALGSALGGAVITRMPRARFAGLAFGWLEIGIGAAAILSIATFGIALDLLRQVESTEFGADLLFGEIRLMTGLCVLTVLPASLLMGATFPVAARLWAAGDGRLGARLGGVYAANVAGGILGSLLAGFLLVPLVGAHTALLTLATVNIALGVWLLWATGGTRRWLTVAVPAVFGVALVAWGASQPPVHSQVFRQHYPEQQLLWYHEGLENTVSIGRRADGVRTLFTNSRGQSNDEHDLVSFYRTIGHLPTLLAPRPARALVVGMGSGVTSSAIAEHPGVEVQIVELSDGMIAAAPHFAATNRDLVNLPNVKINMDDGRNFLLPTSFTRMTPARTTCTRWATSSWSRRR